MEWLLSILLVLGMEVRPGPVGVALRRANERAHGLGILRGKTVLMFGDSMVNCGVNVWLEPWLKRQGVARFVTRSWASSTTLSWSIAPKLDTYLWQYDPDIVIVMLGSNELFHPYPHMKVRPIRTLLGRLAPNRLVLWVGPPAWKPDKGIIATMKAQLPPGRFFDSGKVLMGRQKDGYHPSMAGSKTWAEALQGWLTEVMESLPSKGRGAAAAPKQARPGAQSQVGGQ